MLPHVYAELYERLTYSLASFSEKDLNPSEVLSQSLKIIRVCLNELKDAFLSHPFCAKEDEIHFFKCIKPKFYEERIFCLEIYNLEMNRPVGTRQTIKTFYEEELNLIERFFRQNAFLYQYYRSGATELDDLYFVRGVELPTTLFPEGREPDSDFTTNADYLFAKFRAYERLRNHILEAFQREGREASNCLSKDQGSESISAKIVKPTWTDSKAALIELAYALHSRGAVDNGRVDVKQMAEILENAFNVDLGNYYGVFNQNIRLRKKCRTVYLEQLKEHLERRMDDLDA